MLQVLFLSERNPSTQTRVAGGGENRWASHRLGSRGRPRVEVRAEIRQVYLGAVVLGVGESFWGVVAACSVMSVPDRAIVMFDRSLPIVRITVPDLMGPTSRAADRGRAALGRHEASSPWI